METRTDVEIWDRASEAGQGVISKDEDFVFLALRPNDHGRLVWVRLGNCRTPALLSRFDEALSEIIAAIDSGQRIVEVR